LNFNYATFSSALNQVCLDLAKKVVSDAEGATKFIQVNVGGAKNLKDAKRVALGIANSSLFKTACFGQNPNFGRIVQAVGSSGVKVKEKDLKVSLSGLSKKHISVAVHLAQGPAQATVYTCDLTDKYVKINAEYN